MNVLEKILKGNWEKFWILGDLAWDNPIKVKHLKCRNQYSPPVSSLQNSAEKNLGIW